tara:strand:- start:328 stop:666 length:339 start_codon:yes stop_codon:yes gene_type:complete
MSSRYKNRQITKNRNELYETFLKDRKVNQIRHYRTPRIKHLTSRERSQLVTTKVVFKQGDRFWKLAAQFYGDSKYWWIIAWFNQRPTEASVSPGSVLLIPTPLDKVLELAGY